MSTAGKIKAAVRRRDGYRCAECGMTDEQHREHYGRTLEVHRKTPGSPYRADDCVTLCRRCHAPKPRSPRGSTNLVGLPPDVWDALAQFAKENSDEDNVKSISWAARVAIRRFLRSEGRLPPSPPPSKD